MRHLALFTLLSSSLLANAADAPACRSRSATSTGHQTALLELYTSEGCNSCPPTENWVNGLKAAGFGATQLVPVAFHVDYWDYLGWKDRFAQAAFTQRQQDRVAKTHGRFVYTPEVMLNGKEWQNGTDALRAALAAPATSSATIQAHTDPIPSGLRLALTVDRKAPHPDDAVYIALVEDKLTSHVAAGENAGATLLHNAVVRKLFGPFGFKDKPQLAQSVDIPFASNQIPQNSSIAIWVEDGQSGRVIQALSVDCS